MIAHFKRNPRQWSLGTIIVFAILGYVALTDAHPVRKAFKSIAQAVPPALHDDLVLYLSFEEKDQLIVPGKAGRMMPTSDDVPEIPTDRTGIKFIDISGNKNVWLSQAMEYMVADYMASQDVNLVAMARQWMDTGVDPRQKELRLGRPPAPEHPDKS